MLLSEAFSINAKLYNHCQCCICTAGQIKEINNEEIVRKGKEGGRKGEREREREREGKEEGKERREENEEQRRTTRKTITLVLLISNNSLK